jgi:hypothetical protein
MMMMGIMPHLHKSALQLHLDEQSKLLSTHNPPMKTNPNGVLPVCVFLRPASPSAKQATPVLTLSLHISPELEGLHGKDPTDMVLTRPADDK